MFCITNDSATFHHKLKLVMKHMAATETKNANCRSSLKLIDLYHHTEFKPKNNEQ